MRHIHKDLMRTTTATGRGISRMEPKGNREFGKKGTSWPMCANMQLHAKNAANSSFSLYGTQCRIEAECIAFPQTKFSLEQGNNLLCA